MLIPLIALATAAVAYTTHTKVCQDYAIPVTVTSANYIFGAPQFKDNFDLTDFSTDAESRTAATDFHPFSGHENQTASYVISATFCTPADTTAPNRDTVLLAAHGLNFDRSYWDPAIQPGKYSFVDFAINQGYSVFFYDRLGVGKSSIVSGYLNQLSIQIAISLELSHLIRSGMYTCDVGVPKSLVLVGHSFGSSISAGTVVAEPTICDGLILTGYSYNGSSTTGFLEAAQLRIASSQSPEKWSKLDTGYITLVDIFSNVNTFFKKPDYDIEVVEYADTNKQPIAISELLTTALEAQAPTEFTGAAMVIAGQHDFIFCTGQCDDVIEHPAAEIFSNASAFQAVSYPGSGHGLNFAANATGAYEIIFEFLASSGL